MMFRVSGGRGRPSAPAGQRRRKRMAVARLGDGAAAPRRGGRLLGLGRLVLRRLRLRALLLRYRRALARLRDSYASMVKRLIADAAAAEPAVKARRMVEDDRRTGGATTMTAPAARTVVVPAAVAGAVLRCNSHYYIR